MKNTEICSSGIFSKIITFDYCVWLPPGIPEIKKGKCHLSNMDCIEFLFRCGYINVPFYCDIRCSCRSVLLLVYVCIFGLWRIQ